VKHFNSATKRWIHRPSTEVDNHMSVCHIDRTSRVLDVLKASELPEKMLCGSYNF